MKKLTLKLLSLLAAIVLIIPMTVSCVVEDLTEAERFDMLSETDKAFYILEKDYDLDTSRKSGSISMSYQETNMSMNGYKLHVRLDSNLVTIDTEEQYLNYYEIVVSAEYSNRYTDSESVQTVKTGWIDGKYFEYNQTESDSSGSSTTKSFMFDTKENYLAYLEGQGETAGALDIPKNFGITKENCSTVKCFKQGDDLWCASFSDVSDELLTELKKLAQPLASIVDIDNIEDANITLLVTPDFIPKEVIIFYNVSGFNFLRIAYEYAYGDDVVIPQIDLSDYNEVPSLRN